MGVEPNLGWGFFGELALSEFTPVRDIDICSFFFCSQAYYRDKKYFCQRRFFLSGAFKIINNFKKIGDYMENKYKMLIAKKIELFMTENNMTNEAFGKVFDVSEWVVRRWKSGEKHMNPDQLVRLCQYWNIDLAALFSDDYSIRHINDSELSPTETEIIELYRSNEEFKILVDNATKLAQK